MCIDGLKCSARGSGDCVRVHSLPEMQKLDKHALKTKRDEIRAQSKAARSRALQSSTTLTGRSASHSKTSSGQKPTDPAIGISAAPNLVTGNLEAAADLEHDRPVLPQSKTLGSKSQRKIATRYTKSIEKDLADDLVVLPETARKKIRSNIGSAVKEVLDKLSIGPDKPAAAASPPSSNGSGGNSSSRKHNQESTIKQGKRAKTKGKNGKRTQQQAKITRLEKEVAELRQKQATTPSQQLNGPEQRLPVPDAPPANAAAIAHAPLAVPATAPNVCPPQYQQHFAPIGSFYPPMAPAGPMPYAAFHQGAPRLW